MIWLVLLIEAFLVAWVILGLGLFLPAVGGSKLYAAMIFIAAVMYFVLIVGAIRGLKLVGRKFDVFALCVAAPPVLYYASEAISISRDQSAVRTRQPLQPVSTMQHD